MENTQITILIADDDPDILELLEYNLKSDGYKVMTAHNGKKALQFAEDKIPDLIILDVMMPEMDGFETCMRFKQNPKLKEIPVIFLTAKVEEYSEIAGLDVGADDYITKPIKPRLLLSRIKAVLRRHQKSKPTEKVLEVGEITINKEKYTVTLNNSEIILPKKVFELLVLLASKPGRVYTRDEIYSSIWGIDTIVGDRTIDVHIRKLRKALGDKYIKTIIGVGYKFDLTE